MGFQPVPSAAVTSLAPGNSQLLEAVLVWEQYSYCSTQPIPLLG